LIELQSGMYLLLIQKNGKLVEPKKIIKKMSKLFVICGIIILSLSCSKDIVDKHWYFCEETKCADPWHSYFTINDDDLFYAINKYMNEQQIEISDIEIGFDSVLVQLCKSCSCRTGRYIKIETDSKHDSTLREIGFSKID
jgi:hypothetical protein